MRWLFAFVAFGCSPTSSWSETRPRATLVEVAPHQICPTHGQLARPDAIAVAVPTFRAVALDTAGSAAELRFTYHGPASTTRELASGADRAQIGLKLRAQDSCNVIYVMWRDDKPTLDVSVKINRGMRNNAECGTRGYEKVRTRDKRNVGALVIGNQYVLRAELQGDELFAWINDRLVWRGTLPTSARVLVGPAGFRSDNVAYTATFFAAISADGAAGACRARSSED